MMWSGNRTGRPSRGLGTPRILAGAASLLLLLSVAGCNRGNSGGGSKVVTVAIAPGGAIMQLNQTLQFSALVSNAPTLSIAATNGAVRASNVVSITTTAPHSFVVGQAVTISGVTDTSFVGTFTIASVPSGTTFTYSQTGADATSGGGTVANTAVTWQVNGTTGGSAATGTISAAGLYTAPSTLPPATTASIAASGAVRTSNAVTITTTAAHSFLVGQAVTISGVTAPTPVTVNITATGASRTGNVSTITTTAAHNFAVGQTVTIAGVTDASFNGTFAVTSVPSTTTFTYIQSAANATSGNGTITSTPTSFNGTFVIAAVPSTTTFTYAQIGGNVTSGGGTVSSSAVQVKAVSVADNTKDATAIVTLDSGIVVTVAPGAAIVGTGENFQFNATVVGSSNTNVNWLVNDIAGGNATVGIIDAAGLYTAPANVPSPAVVFVKATAAADPTRSSAATVTVAAASVPTLTAINPTRAGLGSMLQDVYLSGTGFLSTNTVRFNGTPIAASSVTLLNANLLRVRLSFPASQLAAAATYAVDVQQQGGGTTAAFNFDVVPVRPALIGPSPESHPQNGGPTSVDFHGGYYSAAVNAEFNGGLRSATITSPRQLRVDLNAADAGTAGLFSVAVRNSSAAQPLAATNLAISATPSLGAPSNVAVGSNPSAVAINTATGIAVIANRGSNSISLLDLASNTVVNTIAVGTAPTGVVVDNERNVAVVANNGSNNVSIVDLGTSAVTTIGGFTAAPFAVGVNPLTGLALVASQSSNVAGIVDLNTNSLVGSVSIGTGANPGVDVDGRLNWAVVAPGGSGTLSIVDLARRTTSSITATGAARAANVVTITTTANHGLNVGQGVLVRGVTDASFNGLFTVISVPTATTFTYAQTAANATSGGGSVVTSAALATVTLGQNARGISISSETRNALITDPTGVSVVQFSVLDQGVTSIILETGHVAAAVNPLTNIGVTVNTTTDSASVLDLRAGLRLGTVSLPADATAGDRRAIAFDPGTNTVVIANDGSNNVSILSLGAIRAQHVTQVSAQIGGVSTPPTVLTSGTDIPISVTGSGFAGGATVRLDETNIPTVFVNSRRLTATVPAAMLAGPRLYALDVVSGGVRSNVTEFTVIQAIAVTGAPSATCPNGPLPRAVAIDAERDLALVTKTCTNDVDVINMNTGAVTNTIAVGTNPQGIALLSRLGKAVVSNRGSSNAFIIDYVGAAGPVTVNVGSEPLGVAINADTTTAIVANSASDTVSLFNADTGASVTSFGTNTRPVAVAVDPVRNFAAVANSAQGTVQVINLTGSAPVLAGATQGLQGPTAIMFDPVSDRFLVLASLANSLFVIDPDTRVPVAVRVGINPTSLAYNFNSSTLLTVNTASNTISVMDFIDRRVRAILTLPGSQQFAVEIHPRTNVAVLVDENNNRVLLVPLPR